MIGLDRLSEVWQQFQEVHRLCPEMRLGQLMMTIGMLGEDSTGRSLWDLEDSELAEAVERFDNDLRRRSNPAS